MASDGSNSHRLELHSNGTQRVPQTMNDDTVGYGTESENQEDVDY